jgi:hypothetical protein
LSLRQGEIKFGLLPLLYTQLTTFKNDDFHSATAKTVEDAQKLVEAGFEYVCDFGEVKLFRRRK